MDREAFDALIRRLDALTYGIHDAFAPDSAATDDARLDVVGKLRTLAGELELEAMRMPGEFPADDGA